ELIPVVLLEIPIEVLQQAVVNQTAYLRQSHHVRRIGSRQSEQCVLRDNRELILANVPLHVRILAGELLREVDYVGEPRLEVALHRHWLRAAGRLERGRGRRRGTRSERGGRALPRPGGHGECREATYRQEDSHLPHRCTPMSRITPVSRHPRCPRRYSRPALLLAVSIVSLRITPFSCVDRHPDLYGNRFPSLYWRPLSMSREALVTAASVLGRRAAAV